MFSRITVYFVLLNCLLPVFSACRGIRPDGQTQNAISASSSIAAATDTTKFKYKMGSWRIPEVEPCALVGKAEAEALMGLLKAEPKSGGTAIDGTACTYVSQKPFVVTVGIISTVSFESRKFDSGNRLVSNIGDEAYITDSNAFEDVYLFARQEDAAVMINVAAGDWDEEKVERYRIAIALAQTALARLVLKTGENADNLLSTGLARGKI